MPAANIEGDDVCWTIEIRRSDELLYGRRQVRVFHYGQLIDNHAVRAWTYPENGDDYEEQFYVPVSAEELRETDANIPREGQGSNVGLWIFITENARNGEMPLVDLFYIVTPTQNPLDGAIAAERSQYDVLFAYEENLIG